MEKSAQTQEEATGRAKRYGEAVKRQVVEDLERGRITLAQAQRQYGIAGSQTIQAWQGRYGKSGHGGGSSGWSGRKRSWSARWRDRA